MKIETDLATFYRRVGDILDTDPTGSGGVAAAEISRLLPGLTGDCDLLGPGACAAPATGYGRNEVFVCPRDRFSVLAMVWPPGIHSPIHSHITWCALGVWRGVLEETRYIADDRGDRVSETGRYTRRPGEAAYLTLEGENIHAIHNPGDVNAISIHVYGGNIRKTGPNLGKVFRQEA